MMPVARVILQRTLVRGNQCPNTQNNKQNSHTNHHNHHDTSADTDLSVATHRNERLKQKYDNSGKLMYAYGNKFSFQ